MTSENTIIEVDVRTIEPRQRHPLIFRTFDGLASSKSMELINDHDPIPLFYQMQATRPDQFQWTPIEQGPETWRVRITKTGA